MNALPRVVKMILAAGVFTVLLCMIIQVLYMVPSFPMMYGIKAVAEINGHKIFLKRESSSIFDDRTSLSLDGDRCKGADYQFDYRLAPQGAGEYPTYFQVADEQLTVYESLDQPTAKPWPFAVLQKPIDVRDFGTMHNGLPQGVFETQVTGQDLTECHFSLKYFPKRH